VKRAIAGERRDLMVALVLAFALLGGLLSVSLLYLRDGAIIHSRRHTALESKPWTIHADKCVQFKEDAGETRVERLAKAHILGEADAAKYPRVTLVYDLWPDGRVDYNCINWANYRKGGGR